MRLAQPTEEYGYFWLPGKDENKAPGLLHLSDVGKVSLEVLGVFGDSLADLPANSADIGRVVGVLEDGDFITLEGCSYRSRKTNFNGLTKSTVHANFMLSGAQYEENEAITFSGVRFSVEGLDEWLSVSGLRVEHSLKDKTSAIEYSPPAEIKLSLPDGIQLAFVFESTFPVGRRVTEAKITQKAYVSLVSDNLRPMDDFLNLIFKLAVSSLKCNTVI